MKPNYFITLPRKQTKYNTIQTAQDEEIQSKDNYLFRYE